MKFIILLFLTFALYGQVPHEIKFYLASNKVSKTAKDFYNGKFRAADDSRTFSIIDSLKTRNNLTRPFYIFLVSKIIVDSDGALSESLGIKCKEFVELNPDFLVDFLYSKSEMANKLFVDSWAKQIAGEFMIDCEAKEKQCVKVSLQQASTKISIENKPRLMDLYRKIESYCH